MRTTLADVRSTQIPQVLLLCEGDTTGRLQRYLNEAVLRLLPYGAWRGTEVRYRICTINSCITWPRQVEAIRAFALCDAPVRIRSHWYEFLDYGPGQLFADDCRNQALYADRGLACAFDDICGEGKRIRVYADLPDVDAGKTILLQGYDKYRNPVLTEDGDVNGELVTLASPWVDTDTIWMPGGLTGVQKQLTKGPVRLFELDTVTALQRPLAIYEPDETNPEYRRGMVPGLSNRGACCHPNSPANCASTTITVLAKLRFIPVRNETDYLLIGNTAAIKDMCQSIRYREDNQIQLAVAYEQSAVAVLERELSDFHGGSVDPVQTINSHADMGIESMI